MTFELDLNKKIEAVQKNYNEYIFENGVVALLVPQDADWIRTSSSGKWIFDNLKSKPQSTEELVAAVTEHFELPREAVENAVISLITELMKLALATYQGEEPMKNKIIADQKDLSLQEVWFNITNRCNLMCKHCFVPDTRHKKVDISLDAARSVIDQAAEMKVVRLIISGGEPTMHPHFTEIVKYGKEKGLFVKVITNGRLGILENKDEVIPLIDDIQISIDGTNRERHDQVRGKGSFHIIRDLLIYLKENYLDANFGLSYTPLPDNLDMIPGLYRFGVLFFCKYVHLNRPKRPGSQEDHKKLADKNFLDIEFFKESLQMYGELLNSSLSDKGLSVGHKIQSPTKIDTGYDPASEIISRVKVNRCAAGMVAMGINQNGDCFPCAALCDSRHFLGNVKEEKLADIYTKIRNAMESCFDVDKDDKCKTCDFRHFCGGGCRAVGPSVSERDPMCEILKSRMTEGLRVMVLAPLPVRENAEDNNEVPIKQ